MDLAIVLSLAACFCTATASVCQRLGARNLQQTTAKSGGFDPWLVFRLARQPAWLLGLTCMIGGFLLQVSALRFGPLVLVQPILAIELLFVFGYLALLPVARRSGPRVRWRDWLAVAVMCAGISVFLRAAAPSGGRDHAPAGLWWLSGAIVAVVVGIAIALAERAGGTATRRAALLGIATGITWGFVAAVIKELSSHVAGGPAAIFTNWSAYALAVTGAAGMLLASHAFAAGPLAASQPGFTILDPVTATLLGVFLFNEHLATSPAALMAEAIGLILLAAGAFTLSRSDLITAEPAVPPPPPAVPPRAVPPPSHDA
jgi:drug/metabolite transporter (DMT)-like permease